MNFYSMTVQKSKDILRTSLKEAGLELMRHFGKTANVRIKESISSVVTEADFASEKVILEILRTSSFPGNILSEESGFVRNKSEYTWVVDPLDGTSNFAAGLPWFGIIIALFKKDFPVLGGIYLPVEDQMYLTITGQGAFKNDRPIRCTGSDSLENQLIAYSYDFSDEPGKTDSEIRILDRLSKKVRNTRSTNSIIDFCYMADGRLGAAVNQSTKIWDIAVPWLMIREAGGVVTDILGSEIRFDLSAQTFDRNYTIVASGKGFYRELINILKPIK
jgi:myo-inositol-1(or 4)-monophosphatase